MSDIKKLYNALLSKGYTTDDLGDENTFTSKMTDAGSRKELYDYVSSNGHDLGDYDEYEKRLSQKTTAEPTAMMTPIVNPMAERQSVAPEPSSTPGSEAQQKVSATSTPKPSFGLESGTPTIAETTNAMIEGKIHPKSRVKPEPEVLSSFGEGVKQGTEQLAAGAEYAAGEAIKPFVGSQQENIDALARLTELEKEGKDVTEESKWSIKEDLLPFFSNLLPKYDAEIPTQEITGAQQYTAEELAKIENESYRDRAIRKAMEESGGDVEKAKLWLIAQASKITKADELQRNAMEKMSQAKPTKGWAWVGSMVPQMAGNIVGMGLTAATRMPIFAQALGYANMAALTTSTAGQAMAEARQAGASNSQVWGAGIINGAVELLTEKIPFGRYTNRLKNAAKSTAKRALGEAISDVGSPAYNELKDLLSEANKQLGGKLFSANNAGEYLADIAAEGLSEAAAEGLQTIVPIIYENPENYPTFMEILGNAAEGAKGGIFMGAFLGGASKAAAHRMNRARRMQQGYVDVAEVTTPDGENEIVEVVRNKKDQPVFYWNGQEIPILDKDVKQRYQFNFEDFERGQFQLEQDEAYDNGRTLETPQEMNDAANMLEIQAQEVRRLYGLDQDVDIDAFLGENPFQKALDIRKTDEDAGQIILDYLNAKATTDGVVDNAKDKIERLTMEADALIASRTSKTDGLIHPAVMKLHDRKVYVVSGNVSVLDDGAINTQESDEIIIMDATTGKREFASAKDLLSIDEAIDPEAEKQNVRNTIADTIATEVENKMNNVLPFNVGDAYNIIGADGAEHSVQVIADNGDGSVMASIDNAEAVAMPKSEIQQMSNDYNMNRAKLANEAQKEAKQSEKMMQESQNVEPTNVVEQTTETPAEVVPERVVPTLKDGNPDFNAMDADMFVEEYVSRYGEDSAIKIARKNISNARENIAKIDKKIDDITDPNQMEGLYTQRKKAEAQVARYSDILDLLGVSEDANETEVEQKSRLRNVAGNRIAALFPDGLPNVESFILADIATGNRIRWSDKVTNGAVTSRGLGAELGLQESTKERARRLPLIGKDAMTPEEYAESLGERLKAVGIRYDESSLRDAVLDVYQSVDSRKGAWDALENIAKRGAEQEADTDWEDMQAQMAYNKAQDDETPVLPDVPDLATIEEEAPIYGEEAAEIEAQEQAEDYKLSDEVDENGRQFVLASNGDIAFGNIDEESGLTPAPILLSEGIITNPATNDGYGLVHIEARHGDQIRNAGYPSVVSFVEEVAKNYQIIKEGKNRNGNNTYMLQLTDKHNNTLMIELSGDGTYWNINTAGIFKTSYGKNRKEVYNRQTTAKQPAEVVETSQSVELNGTQTPPSLIDVSTPKSSESKDTTSEPQKQEVDEKISQENENLEVNTTDSANLAEDEQILFRNVYHGSGAEFDKFDHSFMGTGEGNQAFGWGTYVTEVEGIGKQYARMTSKPRLSFKGDFVNTEGFDNPWRIVSDLFNYHHGKLRDMRAAAERYSSLVEEDNPKLKALWEDVKQVLSMVRSGDLKTSPARYLYSVEIPDNDGTNYLEYGKPLSKKQLNNIKRALYNHLAASTYKGAEQELKQELDEVFAIEQDGKDIYGTIGSYLGSDKATSEFLNKNGYVGISYPADGGNAGDARNYVIFNEADLDITDSVRFRSAEPAPTFYSNAEYAVKAVKQEKATPEQWLKMIEKNGGLKAGEDKWLGLSDWLKSSDKKTLTKQEVLDFIKENQIQIEEVEYGDVQDLSAEDIRESDEFAALVDSLTDYEIDENGDEYPYINRDRYQELRNGSWNFSEGFSVDYWGEGLDIDSVEAAAEYLGISTEDRNINETRLEYTTDGLENKREIALTVPTIESWNAYDDVHFGDAGNGRAIAWVRFGETKVPIEKTIVKRVLLDAPYKDVNGNDVYRIKETRNHFIVNKKLRNGERKFVPYVNDKPIGTTIETAAFDTLEEASMAMQNYYQEHPYKYMENQRVLVIDEVQSKRHQEGREKGYRPSNIEQYLKDNGVEVIETGEFYEFHKNGELDKRFSKGLIHNDINRAKQMYVGGYVKSDIPSAPFEKNWAELAMKRMLRYAAENGFDKIAWTTGEQQAERYDISKSVDNIKSEDNNVEETSDGTLIVKNITIYAGGSVHNLYVDANGVVRGREYDGKKLSDIVGKPLAEKLMEQGDFELEGDGLRIGGEGMKAFYDQMIPSFMNKYGKKWGVKVGEVTMPSLEENNTMHSIDVTDAMRESVMQGQPMFRTAKSNFDSQFAELQSEYDALDKNDKKAFKVWKEKKRKLLNTYFTETVDVYNLPCKQVYVYDIANEQEIESFYDAYIESLGRSTEDEFFTSPTYEEFKTGLLEADAIYLKGTDIVACRISENINSEESAFNAIIHEQTHSVIYNIIPNDTLVAVWNEANKNDSKRAKKVASYYKGARDRGDEYITYSLVETLTSPKYRDKLESFIKGDGNISADELMASAKESLPLRNETIKQILNYFRDEYRSNSGRRRGDNAIVGNGLGRGYAEGSREVTTNSRRGGSQSSRERRRSEVVEAATDLASSLGVKLNVIEDVNEITDSNTRRQRAKRGAKAWYDVNTDQVYFVLPNAESVADAQQTVLHEVVAHKGLRDVVGRENFKKFLDKVFQSATPEIRSQIVRLAAQNGWNLHTATEEYLASLAEEGFDSRENRTFWQKVRDLFMDMLREAKIALGYNITDNDMRYMLWRTYQMQKSQGAMAVAEDVLMQQKLGVGNFRTRPAGTFDANNDDIRFRSAGNRIPQRPQGIARQMYDHAVRKRIEGKNKVGRTENLLHHLQESYQDSMLSVKELIKAVLAETGNKLHDFEDVYKAENRLSSANKAQIEAWERDYMKPLQAEVFDLIKAGANYEAIVDYILAKSGIERNIVFAERDAQEIADNWEKKRLEGASRAFQYEEKRINGTYGGHMSALRKSLSTGAISQKQFDDEAKKLEVQRNKSIDKLVRKYERLKKKIQADKPEMFDKAWKETRTKDYSGLTELTGEKDNFTTAAYAIVDAFEKAYKTGGLWNKINAATKASLRKSYESGMMNKETFDKVSNMFKYYVPLRGWNNNAAADHYEYMANQGMKILPALKTAKGRTSRADDPIATIGSMGESSIIQGNRNLMKQKLLNFAQNNPTSLLTINEQWYVQQADGTWLEQNPVIPEDATADEVDAIVKQFEADMRALGNKAQKQKNGLKLGLHATNWEGQEHIVRVKRNGKEYQIIVNGNPIAAQAINGFTNPNAKEGWMKRVASWIKNFMARAFTSMNPAFVIINLQRDLIWAGTSVAIKENAAYMKQYAKNTAEAFVKARLPRLISKWKNGTLDMNNPVERYFKEFMENGGETGFTQLNTVDDYKRNMERFIKEAQGGAVSKGKKAWRALWDGVEFLNRSAEDTTRFMVYMTSRQMGRSIVESVSNAKDVTVNFNKKGRGEYGATFMNFVYIFFNASIQSLANFGKLIKEHPKKTTAALTTFTSAGFIAPILSLAVQAMLSDDDDEPTYWDLPEWVRRNNIVLYAPFTDGGYITIPLPHELRPFYGMGELALSVLAGKEDVEDALKKAAEGFASLLPLDFTGNAGNMAVNFTPTIAQPIAQLVINKDYFGTPIYRKTAFNEKDPEWTKAYKSTNRVLVDATEFINELTGGDAVKSGMIDINPAVVEHLFESYLGGMGKTLNRTAKTLGMLWNEDMREWRNVPVLSSFYTISDERTSGSQLNREYFDATDEAEEVEHLFNGYKKQANMGSMEYAEKLSELMESPIFERYKVVEGYKTAISDLNKALREADTTDREELETTIMNLKVEMLEKLNGLESSNK